MEKISSEADARLLSYCYSCGELLTSEWTVDHVPPRVLLERPFPDNIMTLRACADCNSGSSKSEERFACLVEVLRCGSAQLEDMQRESIRSSLENNLALAEGLSGALADGSLLDRDGSFGEDIEAVVLKLFRAHCFYELSDVQPRLVEELDWFAKSEASTDQIDSFIDWMPESSDPMTLLPEVGSRALKRVFEKQDVAPPGWVSVQDGQYRFSYRIIETGVEVRIIVGETFFCRVREAGDLSLF
ncbi:MAG: hypothetical protein ACOYBP_08645 [Microbacteriaceae bacterium]